jgi:hypothetical protein
MSFEAAAKRNLAPLRGAGIWLLANRGYRYAQGPGYGLASLRDASVPEPTVNRPGGQTVVDVADCTESRL